MVSAQEFDRDYLNRLVGGKTISCDKESYLAAILHVNETKGYKAGDRVYGAYFGLRNKHEKPPCRKVEGRFYVIYTVGEAYRDIDLRLHGTSATVPKMYVAMAQSIDEGGVVSYITVSSPFEAIGSQVL